MVQEDDEADDEIVQLHHDESAKDRWPPAYNLCLRTFTVAIHSSFVIVAESLVFGPEMFHLVLPYQLYGRP